MTCWAADGRTAEQRGAAGRQGEAEEQSPPHLCWDHVSADVCTHPVVTFNSLVSGDVSAFAWVTGSWDCFSVVWNSLRGVK